MFFLSLKALQDTRLNSASENQKKGEKEALMETKRKQKEYTRKDSTG